MSTTTSPVSKEIGRARAVTEERGIGPGVWIASPRLVRPGTGVWATARGCAEGRRPDRDREEALRVRRGFASESPLAFLGAGYTGLSLRSARGYWLAYSPSSSRAPLFRNPRRRLCRGARDAVRCRAGSPAGRPRFPGRLVSAGARIGAHHSHELLLG